MNGSGKLYNVSSLKVKVCFIRNDTVVKVEQYRMSLKQLNVLSVEEQLEFIRRLKSKESKKYVCFGILENQVAESLPLYLETGFDSIDLTISDCESLENDIPSYITTHEHKHIQPIFFTKTPLLLNDLGEIVILLREISKKQIKTRKAKLKRLFKSQTRKYIS